MVIDVVDVAAVEAVAAEAMVLRDVVDDFVLRVVPWDAAASG